jgi:hypothetical protein
MLEAEVGDRLYFKKPKKQYCPVCGDILPPERPTRACMVEITDDDLKRENTIIPKEDRPDFFHCPGYYLTSRKIISPITR